MMAVHRSSLVPIVRPSLRAAARTVSLLLLLPCVVLAGCDGAALRPGVLDPAGPVGQAERTILLDSLVIMLGIVVPTILCTLAVAWWYRASNRRAVYAPQWAYSGRLELLVWSIPALVIVFLGGIAWIGSHDLAPTKPLSADRKPLEVQVVALDWKWLFIYPEQHIASLNRLVTPVGTPVHFRLTSASVMNVFFVPELGSEIYAMSGMVTELNLQADRTGAFHGLAAQINGDGFADMTFDTRAVTASEFSEWLATAQANGPTLDDAAYRALLRQSSILRPYTFRNITPNLFEEITSMHLPPGEGPRVTQANAEIGSMKEE